MKNGAGAIPLHEINRIPAIRQQPKHAQAIYWGLAYSPRFIKAWEVCRGDQGDNRPKSMCVCLCVCGCILGHIRKQLLFLLVQRWMWAKFWVYETPLTHRKTHTAGSLAWPALSSHGSAITQAWRLTTCSCLSLWAQNNEMCSHDPLTAHTHTVHPV